MVDPRTSRPDDARPAPTPWPFVIAVGLFVIVATLAAVFLRTEDDGLDVVRSTDLDVIADDVVRVVVPAQPTCDEVVRAQVELTEDRVFVELVVADGGSCDPTADLTVDVVLPEDVGARSLVPGAGRRALPCTPPEVDGRIRCGDGG